VEVAEEAGAERYDGKAMVRLGRYGGILMGIDTSTVALLQSTLATERTRRLFRDIAARRIVSASQLIHTSPTTETDNELKSLQEANLIDLASENAVYYVTAKGLKVARDIAKIGSF